MYAAGTSFHIAVCTVGVILSSPVVDSCHLQSERLQATVFLKNYVVADERCVFMEYGIWDNTSV